MPRTPTDFPLLTLCTSTSVYHTYDISKGLVLLLVGRQVTQGMFGDLLSTHV